jgi:hypothetical protein
LTALLFFVQASLVVARWEEWPLIGLACFRFLPNWFCIKDAESWIEKNCDGDDLNQRNDTQLKILLDIYFQTDNGARSGPLYEQGWLSDCSYCNWEGIACDGEGNIIEFSFAESNPPLAGTIPTELGLLFALSKW